MMGALTLMIILYHIILYFSFWQLQENAEYSEDTSFSIAVTVMLFFSDVEHYVPVKLCKTAGSIHLFKIIGHLTPAQITLKRRLLWDVVQIDWKEVLMTLNRNMVHLPTSVIIPMRDKFRLRCIIRKRLLLLHIML